MKPEIGNSYLCIKSHPSEAKIPVVVKGNFYKIDDIRKHGIDFEAGIYRVFFFNHELEEYFDFKRILTIKEWVASKK